MESKLKSYFAVYCFDHLEINNKDYFYPQPVKLSYYDDFDNWIEIENRFNSREEALQAIIDSKSPNLEYPDLFIQEFFYKS